MGVSPSSSEHFRVRVQKSFSRRAAAHRLAVPLPCAAPPSDTRPALAADVPTRSSQLAHVRTPWCCTLVLSVLSGARVVEQHGVAVRAPRDAARSPPHDASTFVAKPSARRRSACVHMRWLGPPRAGILTAPLLRKLCGVLLRFAVRCRDSCVARSFAARVCVQSSMLKQRCARWLEPSRSRRTRTCADRAASRATSSACGQSSVRQRARVLVCRAWVPLAAGRARPCRGGSAGSCLRLPALT